MNDESEQVVVPKVVYTELEKHIDHTQFENVDEYATYVFEELIHYFDESNTDANISDQEELKERLESLGYIQND